MSAADARDLVWTVAGDVAGFIGYVSVVLIALTLVGMVRR